jgi:hypothetical protein
MAHPAVQHLYVSANGVLPPGFKTKDMVAAKIAVRPRSYGFRPTATRCCKVGEKTARKKLSCSVSIHMVAKRINLVHKEKQTQSGRTRDRKFAKNISLKIAKCSARYGKRLEKCCVYKSAFYKQIRLCKRQKRPDRAECRASARRRYPWRTNVLPDYIIKVKSKSLTGLHNSGEL